jgi:DNA-binding NtrC family response regulator
MLFSEQTSAMDKQKFSVLVVDDEEDIREILSRKLSADGHRILTASDGEQALEKLQDHACDLLITDLKMPKMGGLELLIKVKEKFPTIEIIVMTAYGSIESAVEAMRKGAYDYLTKPISPADINFRVMRALEKCN